MAPCHHVPPSVDELLGQFRGLLEAHRGATVATRLGEGNLRCEGCFDCNRCRFCVQCVRCDDCSNCEQCQDCKTCTKSKVSRACSRSGSLEFCEGCEDSQYLILCVDCTKCSQCFACVGLSDAEFCILNQRYSRKDYFPVVQTLRKRLDELIAAGVLLPEIATGPRGAWPPQALRAAPPTPPEKEPGEPETHEKLEEPRIEPWAEGVTPLRGPGEVAGEENVAVSWAQHPARPPDL